MQSLRCCGGILGFMRQAPSSSRERVFIAGDGQMSLVLADVLAFHGHEVTIWSPFPAVAEELKSTRQSARLPGFRLLDGISVVSDACAFERATIVVNALPTQYIRPTFRTLAAHLPSAVGIVCVAKGIEVGTFERPSEILHGVTQGRSPIAALSGPTIATELARRLPAVMLAASTDSELRAKTAQLFTSPWTRIYQSDDPVGVELAGACKNVIAIAAGLIDGLELGSNAKSALLARGLSEIARVGVALGGKLETFFGVAGVGDLATTCFSPDGRNRRFGERLARETLKSGNASDAVQRVLAESASVVEGVPTCQALVALARERQFEIPIMEAVHGILFERLAPKDAIAALMSRAASSERVG